MSWWRCISDAPESSAFRRIVV
ncbi:unnamed protein product [Spirodela intermedia]|uniref:Uncharacterized protein n=1 Tax=Spirodela intermedia TaxID=51605 RepID=A0ABN7ED64_SPIIN|nr:unnamed protein product [Spirodela intermedia]